MGTYLYLCYKNYSYKKVRYQSSLLHPLNKISLKLKMYLFNSFISILELDQR